MFYSRNSFKNPEYIHAKVRLFFSVQVYDCDVFATSLILGYLMGAWYLRCVTDEGPPHSGWLISWLVAPPALCPQ